MFDRILMPTDGSAYALRAAEYGADIANKYNAELTILYVAELPPVIGIPPSEERQEQTRRDLSSQGGESLRRTREVCESKGVIPVEEMTFGSAVPNIIRYAREGLFDLLVIGSRGTGSGAIEEILIGSVAEGILHGAPCPVLMVRPR